MPVHIPSTRRFRVVVGACVLALLTGCSLLGESDEGSGDDVAPAASAGATAPGATPPAGAPSGPAPSGSAPGGKSGTVTIAFGGDVHFTARTEARLGKGADTLGTIGETLAKADIAMVNFESAITERGAPEAKTYTFRAPKSALQDLKATGVDVVSMANNHAVDFGQPGLTDSLAAADGGALPVVGFGKDAATAFKPWTTEVNGVRVAVVAASQVNDLTSQRYAAGATKPGIATALTSARLVKAVKDAKAQADVVVVYMHWGIEGDKCPSSTQKTLAEELAEAGATAVVGTHAHVMQGAGMLGDTYVGYGFGNFLWYGTSPYPNSNDTGVTTLTLTGGKVVKEEFTPALIDSRGVPVPQKAAEAKRITDRRATLRPCTGLTAAPKS